VLTMRKELTLCSDSSCCLLDVWGTRRGTSMPHRARLLLLLQPLPGQQDHVTCPCRGRGVPPCSDVYGVTAALQSLPCWTPAKGYLAA
jgi:hypothetical protein